VKFSGECSVPLVTFALLPSSSSSSLSILAPYSFNLKHFLLAIHFVITANGFMTFKSFFLGVSSLKI
jgi:hypothetical protein